MKALLARDILGERAGEERRVTLNRAGRNLSARWNDRVREAIRTTEVDLVGSVDDLPVTKVGKDVSNELPMPTDEELLAAAAWARTGLVDAVASLEARVAALRETSYDDAPADADAESDDSGDSHDEDSEQGADDDPEDAGLDRSAMLERQLKDRSPEVRQALTEIVVLVRQAMPLGAELARLRSRSAATG
jgi:hypothetical protein